MTADKPMDLLTLKQYNASQPRKWLLVMTLFVPVIALWAVSSGAMHIDVINILFGDTMASQAAFHRHVLFEIRLPRLLMTFATGAGLALCGGVLQSLFRNPLAEPGLLGISSGAALFAAIGFLILSTLALPERLTLIFIPLMHSLEQALLSWDCFYLITVKGGIPCYLSCLV
jgi:iron complex transport system permease protein